MSGSPDGLPLFLSLSMFSVLWQEESVTKCSRHFAPLQS